MTPKFQTWRQIQFDVKSMNIVFALLFRLNLSCHGSFLKSHCKLLVPTSATAEARGEQGIYIA